MPRYARSRQASLRWAVALWAVGLLLLAGMVVRTIYPLRYRDLLLSWSQIHEVDPVLVAAVIRAESGFRPSVISRSGAVGLMQIMPETARWIVEQMPWDGYSEAQLEDPEVNLALGTWYLHHLLNRFVRLESALMAYNAGPSRAEQWNGDLAQAFPETQAYIRRVLQALPVYRLLLRTPPWLDHLPSLRRVH